jgi:putative transposase
MPYGLKRFQQAESLHFITFSCFHRLPYLSEPTSKYVLETILEETRSRHSARIYAYVLMPEHVHVLINEPPGLPLDQWVKSLKQTASRKLKGSRTHFWQKRYWDGNIRGEDARSEVIRYIHRNPVKRGLVEHAQDYTWSSFHHYRTGARGTVEIESEWTARWRQTHSSPKNGDEWGTK